MRYRNIFQCVIPSINPACLSHSQKSKGPISGTKFLHHAEHTVSDYFKSCMQFYLQPLSQHVSEVNQALKENPKGALSLKTQVAPRGIKDTPKAPKSNISVCCGPVAQKYALNAHCLSERKTQ